jgi:hypothetical protein
MRLVAKHVFAGLAAFILVMPVWARTYKASWTVNTPVSIGGTQVKAGEYQLNADDAKKELTVLQNGKVLATVPGQWVKLPKKADSPSIETDGGKVTQVQFGGSDQAFQPQ